MTSCGTSSTRLTQMAVRLFHETEPILEPTLRQSYLIWSLCLSLCLGGEIDKSELIFALGKTDKSKAEVALLVPSTFQQRPSCLRHYPQLCSLSTHSNVQVDAILEGFGESTMNFEAFKAIIRRTEVLEKPAALSQYPTRLSPQCMQPAVISIADSACSQQSSGFPEANIASC